VTEEETALREEASAALGALLDAIKANRKDVVPSGHSGCRLATQRPLGTTASSGGTLSTSNRRLGLR